MQSEFFLIQCGTGKKLYLWRKGSGRAFLPDHLSKGNLFQQRSRNWSWDWCAAIYQDEREMDGAVRWDSIVPKLLRTFWRQRSTRIFRNGLASTHLWREHDKVRVLWKFQKFLDLHPCDSRTHWWEHDSTRIDGSCCNSIQMERILIPPMMFVQRAIDPQVRTHRWRMRESKQGRPTIFFTPLNLHYEGIWKTNQDQFSPSTRQRIATLAEKVSRQKCVQLCAGTLHLQSELSKRRKDFIRKTLHASTCAEDRTQK